MEKLREKVVLIGFWFFMVGYLKNKYNIEYLEYPFLALAIIFAIASISFAISWIKELVLKLKK